MVGSTGASRRMVRAARRARAEKPPVTFKPADLGKATADRLTSARVFYVGRTRAGVKIDADNALTISSVWACVRFLSQSIAALPWQVIDDETKKPVSMSVPTQRVLDRPSPEWSSMQFRETLMSWALRRGNGYAEIERDLIGNPRAMHPLHPDRVMVMRDTETQELYYSVDQGSGKPPIILEPDDVFHIRGMGETPVGLSVIAYAAESLGWTKAVQIFGSSFFGEGATPAGIITMKKPLSPEGMAAIEKKFRSMYSGTKNAGKTAVLDNDMEYKALSVDPDKGQFIETNQFLVDEVCRWFGVPPHKIYKLLNATFSNIEHQSIEVVTDSLKPWTKRFEDEARYKLLTQGNKRQINRINLKALVAGDMKTRLDWYRGLREIGVISADDILAIEDMPLIGKKKGGDKLTMQGQYTTLEKIGETPTPVAPTPGRPPVEPAPEKKDDDEPAPAPVEPAAPPPPPTDKFDKVARQMSAWDVLQAQIMGSPA
jgi:HK97 family phage portal protein